MIALFKKIRIQQPFFSWINTILVLIVDNKKNISRGWIFQKGSSCILINIYIYTFLASLFLHKILQYFLRLIDFLKIFPVDWWIQGFLSAVIKYRILLFFRNVNFIIRLRKSFTKFSTGFVRKIQKFTKQLVMIKKKHIIIQSALNKENKYLIRLMITWGKELTSFAIASKSCGKIGKSANCLLGNMKFVDYLGRGICTPLSPYTIKVINHKSLMGKKSLKNKNRLITIKILAKNM